MTVEALLAIPKEALPDAAEALDAADIAGLVDMLDLKADEARYWALLILTARSERAPDVYPYWPRFCAKLESDNSYQRTIGILMLAENARWDAEGAIDKCLNGCIRLIGDVKPITARQAIQALGKIARDAPQTAPRIASALTQFDLGPVRDTMRKLLLLDICRALLSLRARPELADAANSYLLTALSGDILDKAAKKEIRSAMTA